mmetsp:Transcript_5240/g.15235  ORF Transcript_5240/g.15235 Transcript_5240/m.15235 type:complete len:230 (-) Transcript_5240:282-971(-)
MPMIFCSRSVANSKGLRPQLPTPNGVSSNLFESILSSSSNSKTFGQRPASCPCFRDSSIHSLRPLGSPKYPGRTAGSVIQGGPIPMPEKNCFKKRGQGVIVGSEAPADTEFSARLSGRIGQDLDCQRIGGRWKIDEAGEKFALIHFAIDNNEYPVYSSLGMKFRQGGSNLLHVFDGVEVPGMGPKDDHGFTVTGDASKLCPNVQVLVCVLILDVTVITEKDFRKRDSQE